MKRNIFCYLAIAFVLAGTPLLAAAPEANAPSSGKAIYSSRPYARKPIRVVQETPQAASQQIPAAPQWEAGETVIFEGPIVSDVAVPSKNMPLTMPTAPQRTEAISPKLAPVQGEQLSLSGIDVAVAPVTKPDSELKPLQSLPMMSVSKQNSINEKVDEFFARLAKIHLEKRRLNECLQLVDKIKSPTFKVKTLVDFAEYISRDKSFDKEATQLFKLALEGIDSLEAQKPIVLKATAEDSSTPTRRPASTFVEEPEKVQPKAEPVKPEPIKVEPKVEPKAEPKAEPKKELKLIDEASEEVQPLVKPIPSTRPSLPTAPRKSLVLEDDSAQPKAEAPKADVPKVEAPKSPEAVKPAEVKADTETIAPLSKPSRRSLSLSDDSADEKTPTLAPEASTTAPKRKSLVLEDEAEPVKESAPVAKPRPSLMKSVDEAEASVKKTVTETEKAVEKGAEKVEEKAAETIDSLKPAPTPTRRPMPSRKSIKLED